MAVSVIPVVNRTTVTEGNGIGGSGYINSFDSRIVAVNGGVVTIVVICTCASIPAWTQFLTIAEAYRNGNLTHLRIMANKDQTSDYVELSVNPSNGRISTLTHAISSGTLLSFYVTYVLP